MTGRDWVMALATTLGVGLLPGCLHFPRSASSDSQPPEVRPTAKSTPTAAAPAVIEQSATDESPYPVVPTRPVALLSQAANSPTYADLPRPPVLPPESVCAAGSETRWVSKEQDANGLSLPGDMLKPAAAGTRTIVGSQVIPMDPKPDADPPLLAALRCMLEQRQDDAVARLQEFDKANQEVLLCLLPLAVRLSQGALDRTSPGELTVMVDQADGVAAPLRRRAPLVIDKMCFCRRIDKFGQYEPLPDRRQFHPGELVQVYAELRNFSSDAGKAGFETRLASSVRLTCHTADGRTETVWRQDFHDRDRVDRSRSPRHDYFNNYRFCIPENIPLGSYKLWLKVIDVPTGRSAEGSLPLVVTLRRGP